MAIPIETLAHINPQTGIITGALITERRLSDMRGFFVDQAAYETALANDDKVLYTLSSVEPAQGEGPWPAILAYSPFQKERFFESAKPAFYCPKGYVCVQAAERGSGFNEGRFEFHGSKAAQDGYDLVEWIAEQPWCNGNVGMYGLSYMGWTQWWTASQSPPALRAIVPEVAPPDHFYNCPYQNGIFVCWMMDWAGALSARLPHQVHHAELCVPNRWPRLTALEAYLIASLRWHPGSLSSARYAPRYSASPRH